MTPEQLPPEGAGPTEQSAEVAAGSDEGVEAHEKLRVLLRAGMHYAELPLELQELYNALIEADDARSRSGALPPWQAVDEQPPEWER